MSNPSQVWACLQCGQERQWGFGVPDESIKQPLLNCAGCKSLQRHEFKRISYEEVDYAPQRYVGQERA